MRPREAEVRSEWEIPAGVAIAPAVPLDGVDPAALPDTARRQCISLTKAGARCRVNAMTGRVLCPAHAGHLDSSAGGLAKAAKSEARQAEAQERMVVAAMGARAIIRQAVVAKHRQLTATVEGLLDAAAAGDRRAAQLLLGYLTQGFGSPTVPTGDSAPPDASDLGALSTDELRAMAHKPSSHAGLRATPDASV